VTRGWTELNNDVIYCYGNEIEGSSVALIEEMKSLFKKMDRESWVKKISWKT